MQSLDERDFTVSYASTAMPVRYAIERRQWVEAARIVPPHEAPSQVIAISVWGRALGLARSGGNPTQVHHEIDRLHQLEEQLRTSGSEYWAMQVRIQAVEVSGWLAQAEGRADEARDLLRRTADEEDAIEKLPVTPGPIVPAREQLGDLLLAQNKPKRAVEAFQRALNAPKRRGALSGLSRATELERLGGDR